MSIRTLKLWEVLSWDGGSRHTSTGFFFTNKEAGGAYKEKNRFDHIEPREFVLLDTVDDLDEAQLESTRKRALDKLTPAERKALGY